MVEHSIGHDLESRKISQIFSSREGLEGCCRDKEQEDRQFSCSF